VVPDPGCCHLPQHDREAVKSAEKSAKLKSHRDGSGRVRFHRDDLDRFATAGDS
jgi:hypothetical protein